MVRMRRKNYEKPIFNDTNGEKTTTTGMEPTKDSGMAVPVTSAISAKALQEILAESQKYVSPPRPMITTPTATTGMTYQLTPVTHRYGTQPRFGTPTFRYAQSFVRTTATMAGTLILSTVKAEMATGDPYDDDGMVTVSYMRSAMDPSKWEPVRITLDKFRNRYGNPGKITKKQVSFEDDNRIKLATGKVRLTPEEEDFITRVEEWATTNKELTDWAATEEYNEEPEANRKRFDKMATEKVTKMETGLATGNYESRLVIVKNLPKLLATEHLTGADNYDGWNTKMKRFFAAFDVTEYIEKPLHNIKEADKIKCQLGAILLSIHGNISTELQ